MKFDLQPYKLFTKKDVGVFIKQNLRGSFTWTGYVKNNKPDPKFGHTRFEYFLQIPVIGILGMLCGIAVVTPIIYYGIFIQQIKEK